MHLPLVPRWPRGRVLFLYLSVEDEHTGIHYRKSEEFWGGTYRLVDWFCIKHGVGSFTLSGYIFFSCRIQSAFIHTTRPFVIYPLFQALLIFLRLSLLFIAVDLRLCFAILEKCVSISHGSFARALNPMEKQIACVHYRYVPYCFDAVTWRIYG